MKKTAKLGEDLKSYLWLIVELKEAHTRLLSSMEGPAEEGNIDFQQQQSHTLYASFFSHIIRAQVQSPKGSEFMQDRIKKEELNSWTSKYLEKSGVKGAYHWDDMKFYSKKE